MAKEPTVKTQVALMKKDIDYVVRSIDDLKVSVNEVKKNTEANFVTKAEFTPVKQIVYGIIGLVLMAVFGALISLVILK